MLNLISCELLKLKRSKMVLISVAGVLSTPLLMLIEALQTHFDKPEIIFTLSDIYSDSVLYIMLLVNIMIYVAIAAYLFSREYTESTLKTILPIPISRTKLLIGKFCTLLLWIVMLTLVTWAGIFIVCGLYDAVFTLEGYSLLVAIVWLPKFLFGSILMFLTVSPFVFVAMKTKGFVAPMIGSAVIVMGSAALSNQEWGALYPWTATYFLVQGKLQSTGYPTLLSVSIIILVSAVGFLMTFHHGNLSSQVQQQIGKDFRGGVPVEAFARTMIQLFCKLGQSLCRKRNLIGVFGNVLPQQAVDLLV